jgi:hypothetical protein
MDVYLWLAKLIELICAVHDNVYLNSIFMAFHDKSERQLMIFLKRSFQPRNKVGRIELVVLKCHYGCVNLC